jgi:hypothetical protein
MQGFSIIAEILLGEDLFLLLQSVVVSVSVFFPNPI